MGSRMRGRPIAVLASAVVAAVVVAAPSWGAETYTLDGVAVSASQADNAPACAGIADAQGTVACFSSQQKLVKAQAAAVRQGKVPPGWGILPTNISATSLANRLLAEANTAPAAGAARVKGKVIAHAASAGSYCYGYTNIHIWKDAGPSGTTGDIGPTGGWYDLSSSWTNSISSYRNSDVYTSWFSDYAGGSGATYGAIAHCWYNTDLSSATMSDSGTANDRFSSAYVGN
jgi:hypothetical protein